MEDYLTLQEIGLNHIQQQELSLQQDFYYERIIESYQEAKTYANIYMDEECLDSYLLAISYLCKLEIENLGCEHNIIGVKNILNIPIKIRKTGTYIYLYEYLILNGRESNLLEICSNILELFRVYSNLELLDIEFIYLKSKIKMENRVESCRLIENFIEKVNKNSFLYIECLTEFADLKLLSGQYTDSYKLLNKAWSEIKRNTCISQKYFNNICSQKILILEDLAWLNMKRKKWYKATTLYDKAYSLCIKCKKQYRLIYILTHRGILKRKRHLYISAIKDLQQAKKIAKYMNMKISSNWINSHICYVYLNLKKYNKAEKLAQKCLKSLTENNKEDTAGDFYDLMGIIKLGQNEIDDALSYFDKSLKYRISIANPAATSASYTHISLAYFLKKEYKNSFSKIKNCHTLFFEIKVLSFKFRVINILKLCQLIYIFLNWSLGDKSVTP